MIGVFDSGFGGLTVLRSFLEKCPQYNYIYLGDNARVPYGNKSKEIVYEYTREAVDFLFAQGCELIILACNTASALALRKLQREYLPKKFSGKKILGVVRPIAEAVAQKNNVNKVGVIGTKATIDSLVYNQEIGNVNVGKKVIAQSAPLLVPLIEEGYGKKQVLDIILKDYLQFLYDNNVDELILACTHYPLLINYIRDLIPNTCVLQNPGEIIAESLCNYLSRHREIKPNNNKKNSLVFYTTDSVEKFKELGEKFLGRKIKNINKINL